jgi:hypothetical protein
MIRSGFKWTGVALPPMPGDDSRYDLEHGAAMWGIATDAEPRQACVRGKGSGRKATTDLGNMVVGWYPPTTTSMCFNLLPDAFSSPLWAPRIPLQMFRPDEGVNVLGRWPRTLCAAPLWGEGYMRLRVAWLGCMGSFALSCVSDSAGVGQDRPRRSAHDVGLLGF